MMERDRQKGDVCVGKREPTRIGPPSDHCFTWRSILHYSTDAHESVPEPHQHCRSSCLVFYGRHLTFPKVSLS